MPIAIIKKNVNTNSTLLDSVVQGSLGFVELRKRCSKHEIYLLKKKQPVALLRNTAVSDLVFGMTGYIDFRGEAALADFLTVYHDTVYVVDLKFLDYNGQTLQDIRCFVTFRFVVLTVLSNIRCVIEYDGGFSTK